MDFPNTTKEEDDTASQEGLRIFGELRKKYCNDSCSHLDIVFNSLCAALIRHAKLYVREEDYKNFIKLVINALAKNLLKTESQGEAK